jgi:hypothetical protein
MTAIILASLAALSLVLAADVVHLRRERDRLRRMVADLGLANRQLADELATERDEHEATLAILRVAGRLNRRLAVEKYGDAAVEAHEREHGEGGKN